MADILANITGYKLAEIGAAKAARPLPVIDEPARRAPLVRSFSGAIAASTARAGRRSSPRSRRPRPSKGLIRADFDPPALAAAYEAGGAACLSVLTDTPSFQGAPEYLTAARAATSLPALRKDFMLDTYQVAEARAWGADCILIILAQVDDATAHVLAAAATDWGMDAIVEVHDDAELERALALDCRLDRHQQSQPQDVRDHARNHRAAGARACPRDRIVVGESGIFTPADLDRLARAGVATFLVGESLMRQADVAAATRALLAGTTRAAHRRHLSKLVAPRRERRGAHGRCLGQGRDRAHRRPPRASSP